jgi:hypothetical protein
MNTLIKKMNTPEGRKLLSRSLIVGMGFFFGCYSFAIASTTLSIARSREYNESIQEVQTNIAELEAEYFALINTLSLEGAEMHGFAETSRVHFVHKNPDTAVALNFKLQ